MHFASREGVAVRDKNRAARRPIITGLVAIGAAIALAVSGCSSSGSGGDSSSKVEISFLTHWGPDQVKQLQAAATGFTKKNPNITVKFQAVPFANLLSTLRTQGASPTGPTIANVYGLWLPELIRDGIAAKAPSDAASDISKNWPDNLVKATSKDGTPYGIPNEDDLYQLNYNTKLFKDAGLSGPPKTFDELVSDAKALTNKATGTQGFGVITNWDSGAVHPFLSLAASNDGYLFNSDRTKATLTSANVKAVADLYAKLIADGSTNPQMSAANANTTGPFLDNFANGKTGMIIMANWWESALKQAMGDKFSDIATAAIPVGPSGTKSSTISYSWSTIVNGKADQAKQKAAWKFLTYLNGPDSGKNGSSALGDILMGMGSLPSRTSDIKAHSDTLADPFLKAYVAALPDATPFPSVIGGAAITQEVQKHIEALIFGKETAADAMTKANAAVDSTLSSGK